MDHLGPASFAVGTNVIQVDLNTKCQMQVSAFDNTSVHVYNVWKSWITPKQLELMKVTIIFGKKKGFFFPFVFFFLRLRAVNLGSPCSTNTQAASSQTCFGDLQVFHYNQTEVL